MVSPEVIISFPHDAQKKKSYFSDGGIKVARVRIKVSAFGGVYNVLFGGIATLGGLVLLTGAIALFLNVNLKPVSYFAAVVGLYAFVEAYSMLKYSLTSNPLLYALGYMSFAAPALLSVPATHLENKWWKWLFVKISVNAEQKVNRIPCPVTSQL